jgi:hypothetical protein
LGPESAQHQPAGMQCRRSAHRQLEPMAAEALDALLQIGDGVFQAG